MHYYIFQQCIDIYGQEKNCSVRETLPRGHLSPSYPICVKRRELWAISRAVSVSSLPQTGDPFVLSQREWGVNACFKLTKHCSQISHHAHTSAHTPFLSIATVRAGCLFLSHQSFISLLSGSISAASPPSFVLASVHTEQTDVLPLYVLHAEKLLLTTITLSFN